MTTECFFGCAKSAVNSKQAKYNDMSCKNYC